MTPQTEPKSFGQGDFHFYLPGPAGKIEVLLSIPPQADYSRCAMICHPHPLQGGTMHNKVVTTTAKACFEMGIPTLRFQFRGVGDSEGTHDGGLAEQDDAIFLAQWIRSKFSQTKLIMAGFSFGAFVAAASAQTIQPDVLISIAPSVGYRDHRDYDAITNIHCPWHVLVPDADEVVSAEQVFAWFSAHQTKIAAPFTLHRFVGSSHFFHGKLIDLKMTILQILSGA